VKLNRCHLHFAARVPAEVELNSRLGVRRLDVTQHARLLLRQFFLWLLAKVRANALDEGGAHVTRHLFHLGFRRSTVGGQNLGKVLDRVGVLARGSEHHPSLF
jgi:hypothetical protein